MNDHHVLSADQRLDTMNQGKLRVITTSRWAELRRLEGVDRPPHELRRISLRVALHIRILVRGVCPSAGTVLLCMMKANGVTLCIVDYIY